MRHAQRSETGRDGGLGGGMDFGSSDAPPPGRAREGGHPHATEATERSGEVVGTIQSQEELLLHRGPWRGPEVAGHRRVPDPLHKQAWRAVRPGMAAGWGPRAREGDAKKGGGAASAAATHGPWRSSSASPFTHGVARPLACASTGPESRPRGTRSAPCQAGAAPRRHRRKRGAGGGPAAAQRGPGALGIPMGATRSQRQLARAGAVRRWISGL